MLELRSATSERQFHDEHARRARVRGWTGARAADPPASGGGCGGAVGRHVLLERRPPARDDGAPEGRREAGRDDRQRPGRGADRRFAQGRRRVPLNRG